MGKLGGLALISALTLTACSAPAATDGATETPTASASDTANQRIAPLLSIPSESAIPSPTPSLPPEFYDDSARGRYLADVKKALNAWRDGVVPSDDELLQGAGAACSLLAEGKTNQEIAGLAGTDSIVRDNAAAVAAFAGKHLCTAYNNFR